MVKRMVVKRKLVKRTRARGCQSGEWVSVRRTSVSQEDSGQENARGRSQTTWTKFCPILTMYLCLVDTKIVVAHASSGNRAMPTPELLIPHRFSYFTRRLKLNKHWRLVSNPRPLTCKVTASVANFFLPKIANWLPKIAGIIAN